MHKLIAVLLVAGSVLLGFPAIAESQVKGTIDDVVTDKVVAVRVPDVELAPGQKLAVLRGGEVVGKLEVRTASGICRVLEGSVQMGDEVLLLPEETEGGAEAGAEDRQIAETAAVTGALREVLLARGELELAIQVADQAGATLPDAAKALVEEAREMAPRLFAAAWLVQLETLAERVAASLRQHDEPSLAEQLQEKVAAEPVLAPIWPEGVPESLLPAQYGSVELVDANPHLWGAPAGWNEKARMPAFAGWSLGEEMASFGLMAEPLVRTDFVLDDVAVEGELRIEDGEFAFILLRSGVVVKFYAADADEHAGKVAAKFGYDNLRVVDAISNSTWIEAGRWQRIAVKLEGEDLEVRVDGELAIASNITSGIMGETRRVAPSGHVGIGGYRAEGAFRNLRVKALSAVGKDALPRFRGSREYAAEGSPVRMLELPPEEFISLSHHVEEPYKGSVHAVKDGVLTVRGAPYSQFSVRGIAGDHFRASGTMKATRRGRVWFRVNRYLLFGLDVEDAQRDDGEKAAFPFVVSHTTSSYRDVDETFPGQALKVGVDYDWEIEYHEPVGVFRLNGEPVMMSLTPREKSRDDRGPNQIGFSVYVTQVEIGDVVVQQLSAEPVQLALSADALVALLKEGTARARGLAEELTDSDREADRLAALVLRGERPARLATQEDYVALAEQYRDRHDWRLYLALLKANAQRFDEGTAPRLSAQQIHELANQKYQVAIETADIGDIGLDGILRVGDAAGPMAVAADRQHLWIAIPEAKVIALYASRDRRIVRTIPVAVRTMKLVARAEYLLAVDEEGKRLLKISTEDGSVVGDVVLPKGTILELAADTRSPRSWFTVNENAKDEVKLDACKVFALDEEAMEAQPTRAIGMFLAVDPLGRYLYTGFSLPMTMSMRLDPGSLMIMPANGYIDHLLCYRIDDAKLDLLDSRAAPGIAGAGIVCDPRGRLVAWLARGGYMDMMDPTASAPHVPVYWANNIRSLRDLYPTGQNTSLLVYNPVRPEIYTYNGNLVRRFHAYTFTAQGSIVLPEEIGRSSVRQLLVSPDGDELLIAYNGKPGGVYLHRLPSSGRDEADPLDDIPTELAVLPPEQMGQRAESIRQEGDPELADRLLRYAAEQYAFTKVGNHLAALLSRKHEQPLLPVSDDLHLLPPTTLEDRTDIPNLEELELPPVADRVTAVTPEQDEAETEWQETLEMLRSFGSLAERYPDSWLHLCEQVASEHRDDPRLLLLGATVLLRAERHEAASQLAARVIEAKDPEIQAKGFALLAAIYEKVDEPGPRLTALLGALRAQPRNAFLHKQLGDAAEVAGLPNLARHQWLLSYYLYPSQHELREKLETLKLLQPRGDESPLVMTELFRRTSPSVVLIKQDMGVGTGFFISRGGLLLSNNHVVGDREEVEVVYSDSEGGDQHTVKARVVGSDPQRDMALLRLDPGDRKIQPLIVGGGPDPSTGDRVIAIGNPGMGTQVLTQTLTEGIISNLHRDIGGQRYLQTSAAVNPGNSGGPLLAQDGTVIGMITLKAQLDNVGFAIPTSVLLEFVREHVTP